MSKELVRTVAAVMSLAVQLGALYILTRKGPTYTAGMSPLPASVECGGTKVKISVESIPGFYGMIQYPEPGRPEKILLDPDQTYQEMQDTLLHEIVHCVQHASPGWGTHTDEEVIIHATTPGLLDVLQNNPEVVRYLTAKGR